MKAVRQVVAITLVATALCADRVVAAPQNPRPDADSQMSRSTFVSRLSVNLRRCVRSARLVEVRREADRPVSVKLVADCPIVMPVAMAPFQFRMPPPID
jgi:hypothetical protein